MSGSSDVTPIWTGTSTAFSEPIPADGTTDAFGLQWTDAAGNSSTIAIATATTPSWLTTFQPDDSTVSYPSWYGDNWYDLGTGFFGTIRSLTLEGHVNNPDYFASHVYIDEFLDAGYTELSQTFTISDDAPFTATSTRVTIGGITIPLLPNKYYRLRTYQDYQNRSVILAGTTATGSAMYDSYIVNRGGVQTIYAFEPYLAWTFIPGWPPLSPPTSPAPLSVSFDEANLKIHVAWPASSDVDTTSSLVAYDITIATSTTFDDSAWQSVGGSLSYDMPVTFGNAYAIAVRAEDDLGQISPLAETTWNFPAGYFPLPSQLNHDSSVGGPEEFNLAGSIVISAVDLWIGGNFGPYCCSQSYLTLSADANGAPGNVIAISSPVGVRASFPGGEESYQFQSSVSLTPGNYWLSVSGGPSPTTNGTTFFGSNGQMYFRLETSE